MKRRRKRNQEKEKSRNGEMKKWRNEEMKDRRNKKGYTGDQVVNCETVPLT